MGAIAPFPASQRARQIIKNIGIDKINRSCGRLKRADVPRPTPRPAIGHFHVPLSDRAAQMPNRFTGWRNIAAKYSLNSVAGLPIWLPALEKRGESNLPNPAIFRNLSICEFNRIIGNSPFLDLPESLRSDVFIEFAPVASIPKFRSNLRNRNTALVGNMVDSSPKTYDHGKELELSKNDIGLPGNWAQLGPTSRISALRKATTDSQKLWRLLSAVAQKHILEHVRSSRPSVASWVGCYLSFCALLGVAPFRSPRKLSRVGSQFAHRCALKRYTLTAYSTHADYSRSMPLGGQTPSDVSQNLANTPPRGNNAFATHQTRRY